jgi:hypothetical protein
MKWIDPEAVREFAATSDLLPGDEHHPFDVDVTRSSPDETARRILERVAELS